jgi:hypothetical protein
MAIFSDFSGNCQWITSYSNKTQRNALIRGKYITKYFFLKDFIICIEMLIAAVAHLLAFNVKPYRLETQQNWWRNILNAANISDVHSEVAEHCKHIGSRVHSMSSSLTGSLYRINTQERIKQYDETSRLLDNESFNSYSYTNTFKSSTNIETASNFSNTALNSKYLTDQSSMANLCPSSLKSTDNFRNTSEKLLNTSVSSDLIRSSITT